MASNYQLSHLSPCGDRTPASEVGGESVTTLPPWPPFSVVNMNVRYNKISVNNAKQCTNKINKTTQKVCDYIFAFI